ncbi:hypothetical protein BDF19DRAFT_410192 [Syncephalis fuscata]|nr:hypothetical protein BDF19DRAFT_410192 [Syncephalis fuscata]
MLLKGIGIVSLLLIAQQAILASAVSQGIGSGYQRNRLVARTSLSTPMKYFGDKINGFSVDEQGNVYGIDSAISGLASNRPINTIGRIKTASNTFDTFYSDTESSTYFTGMRMVKNLNNAAGGRALLTDKANRRVIELSWTSKSTPSSLRLGASSNGKRKVLCKNSQFPILADLAVSPNGKFVYLSGRTTEGGPTGTVWLCDKDGKTTLLDTMGPTRGIEIEPTGKYLFVSELATQSGKTFNKVWRYNINSSTGKVSGKKVFYQFGSASSPDEAETLSIRADRIGSIFIMRQGHSEITKVRASGKLLAIVHTAYSSSVTVALGYKDGKTLYIGALCPNPSTPTTVYPPTTTTTSSYSSAQPTSTSVYTSTSTSAYSSAAPTTASTSTSSYKPTQTANPYSNNLQKRADSYYPNESSNNGYYGCLAIHRATQPGREWYELQPKKSGGSGGYDDYDDYDDDYDDEDDYDEDDYDDYDDY